MSIFSKDNKHTYSMLSKLSFINLSPPTNMIGHRKNRIQVTRVENVATLTVRH